MGNVNSEKAEWIVMGEQLEREGETEKKVIHMYLIQSCLTASVVIYDRFLPPSFCAKKR